MSASAWGGSSFCHLWFCPCIRGAVEGFWELLASLSNGGNPQTTMSEFALKLINLYSYVGSIEMQDFGSFPLLQQHGRSKESKPVEKYFVIGIAYLS